jgi:hypothetical protein
VLERIHDVEYGRMSRERLKNAELSETVSSSERKR